MPFNLGSFNRFNLLVKSLKFMKCDFCKKEFKEMESWRIQGFPFHYFCSKKCAKKHIENLPEKIKKHLNL